MGSDFDGANSIMIFLISRVSNDITLDYRLQ